MVWVHRSTPFRLISGPVSAVKSVPIWDPPPFVVGLPTSRRLYLVQRPVDIDRLQN